MKLRVALFLSAAFLAAAFALTWLPACSDDPGEFDCAIQCNDCYVISQGDSGGARECVCLDPSECGIEPEPPTCAEQCAGWCFTVEPDGTCNCYPCP